MELREVPSAEWQARYDDLVADPWLQRKIDRKRRIREHEEYIQRYCPEIRERAPGLVIDIGPGPGEFLELCRSFGYDAIGIDAASGDGGMGDAYLEVSRMMQERQQLQVFRSGLMTWLEAEHKSMNGRVSLINSRGSIEQAFSGFMLGEPHHLHQNCRRLAWDIGPELRSAMERMFATFARLLRAGGSFVLRANGAANADEYDDLVTQISWKIPSLAMVRKGDGADMHTFHKWTKK